MTNNDILRSVRYILNINETKLIEIIGLADFQVSKDDITAFLRQEDEIGYRACSDEVLAHFLDGLIIYKRGKKEATNPQPLNISMSNNFILKKLRVAFELKDIDIVRLVEKSGLKVSKTELSAFFRNPDHRNYRDCKNQFLRNLLRGMSS